MSKKKFIHASELTEGDFFKMSPDGDICKIEGAVIWAYSDDEIWMPINDRYKLYLGYVEQAQQPETDSAVKEIGELMFREVPEAQAKESLLNLHWPYVQKTWRGDEEWEQAIALRKNSAGIDEPIIVDAIGKQPAGTWVLCNQNYRTSVKHSQLQSGNPGDEETTPPPGQYGLPYRFG